MRDVDVCDASDGNGPYVAKWTLPNPQPTNAEIDALIPAMDAPKVREAAYLADTERAAFLNVFLSATPDQVKTYVNNNTADLATIRALLRRIMLLLAYAIRK